jgi:hypothetical protein
MVKFDKNDGSGNVIYRKATSGAVKLLTTEIALPGAELAGWSTTADAKDIVTPNLDGTYNMTSNTTLYAIWKWSKPSVVCSVTSGAISVDPSAVQNIKLAIGVTNSVSGGAISVSGGVIIMDANESYQLNVTKSVSNNVTSQYIIQYTAVDMHESDLSSANWNDIVFTENNAVVNVPASSVKRKIYIRVISGAGSKILNGDEVLLITN